MSTAPMKSTPPKRMNLGVDADMITKSIAAAQEVARETNVPTSVYPQNKQVIEQAPAPVAATAVPVAVIPAPLPASDKKGRGARPAPVRRCSVDLPLYVIHEIHQLAFSRGVTKKRVVLEAFQAGGLKVKDIDITESGEVLNGGADA
ncbi:MAG: hypothetical protein K2Y42_06680 [Hyphomicrobium sp.]|jgi:hypothetical protein|uniref:hypothetical protein n=1 Tax=Hyphomicrobium sp. TaxID=82 RepID=UPI0025C24CFC|nr:hypothetical protein [Hyphomicrobium sp.]MBX9862423.1 hypothetical protein [Hyphomicrobium sp.]